MEAEAEDVKRAVKNSAIFSFNGYTLSTTSGDVDGEIIDPKDYNPVSPKITMDFIVKDVKIYTIAYLAGFNSHLPRKKKKRIIGTRSLRRREQRW